MLQASYRASQKTKTTKRTMRYPFASQTTAVILLILIAATGAQIVGVDICGCQPAVYELTVDLSIGCEDGTITSSTEGIARQSCLVVDTENGNEAANTQPSLITVIQILELNGQQNIIAERLYSNPSGFVSGSTVQYTSVLSTLQGTNDPGQIPQGFQIVASGINTDGIFISQQIVIEYDNDCGIFPLLFEGDQDGWFVFTDLGPPPLRLCPAAPPTLSPSSAPSLFPSFEPTVSVAPSTHPSFVPTRENIEPSTRPSFAPTREQIEPTQTPSTSPTVSNTDAPTDSPSSMPSGDAPTPEETCPPFSGGKKNSGSKKNSSGKKNSGGSKKTSGGKKNSSGSKKNSSSSGKKDGGSKKDRDPRDDLRMDDMYDRNLMDIRDPNIFAVPRGAKKGGMMNNSTSTSSSGSKKNSSSGSKKTSGGKKFGGLVYAKSSKSHIPAHCPQPKSAKMETKAGKKNSGGKKNGSGSKKNDSGSKKNDSGSKKNGIGKKGGSSGSKKGGMDADMPHGGLVTSSKKTSSVNGSATGN